MLRGISVCYTSLLCVYLCFKRLYILPSLLSALKYPNVLNTPSHVCPEVSECA